MIIRPQFRLPAKRLLAIAALAAAVLLSGCADQGDGQPAGDAASATFVAVDIDWQDAPDELPAGEISLTLDNQGSLEHNLSIEGVEGDQPLVEAAGGETAEGTVQLEPGTYTYYCGVPGHREAGMEGTLEITG